MSSPAARATDQLSLLRGADAGPADSVDRLVPDDTPAKPKASRPRRRRPRGTGAVFQRGNRWYGQWYIRGKLVKRSLGPMREPGSRTVSHELKPRRGFAS
jgi:hypothetical protein